MIIDFQTRTYKTWKSHVQIKVRPLFKVPTSGNNALLAVKSFLERTNSGVHKFPQNLVAVSKHQVVDMKQVPY